VRCCAIRSSASCWVSPSSTASSRPWSEEKKVIFASSLGTVFEWYDFYLYGSLAAIIAKQFFSGLDEGSAFIFALLASRPASSCAHSARCCSDASAT
jgi:hypothetical protein